MQSIGTPVVHLGTLQPCHCRQREAGILVCGYCTNLKGAGLAGLAGQAQGRQDPQPTIRTRKGGAHMACFRASAVFAYLVVCSAYNRTTGPVLRQALTSMEQCWSWKG